MSEEKVEDTINNEQEEKTQPIDLAKINKSLAEEVQELNLLITKLKEEQNKLILATKVNTLKEQEIRNEEFKKYSNQKLIKETIIPLLLEFERALNFKTENKDVKNFLVGFNHIFNNFKESLKSEGLTQISTGVGNIFDSNKNNVTEQIDILEETNDKKDNMIAEVVLSGYKLHDRVVSPSQVKIYKFKNETKTNE